MKKSVMFVSMIGVLAAGIVVAGESGVQLAVVGDVLRPRQGGDWEKAYGATVRAVFWQNAELGIGVSVGAQKWKVNEDVYNDGGVSVQLQGGATVVLLGASGLYKIVLGESACLLLEGGVRYAMVKSDMEAEASSRYYRYGSPEVYEIEIENGVVGLLAADAVMKVNERVGLFVGVGYQFDLVKGKATTEGEELAKNELAGMCLRVGVAVDL